MALNGINWDNLSVYRCTQEESKYDQTQDFKECAIRLMSQRIPLNSRPVPLAKESKLTFIGSCHAVRHRITDVKREIIAHSAAYVASSRKNQHLFADLLSEAELDIIDTKTISEINQIKLSLSHIRADLDSRAGSGTQGIILNAFF